MKNIVKVENGELVVTLGNIAEFSGNDIRYTKELILKHNREFLKLGLDINQVNFKGLKPLRLTETQTNFLLMLMRNSENIIKFKFELSLQIGRLKFSLEKIHENEIIQLKHNLLKKRDAYGHQRKGNSQSVVNLIREYNIEISAGEFNELLFKYGMVNRTPKEGYDYKSPTMNNGTPLINVDMALALIDTNNYPRGLGYADNRPTLF